MHCLPAAVPGLLWPPRQAVPRSAYHSLAESGFSCRCPNTLPPGP
jgi:hypothetical protein